MSKRIIAIFILSYVCTFLVMAQLAVGKWKTHFAYNSTNQLVQSDSKIYAVSNGALYSVGKQDGELELYSKISGLNGDNIAQIGFDAANDQLLILYSNGNIDLLSNGGVFNIPDYYYKMMSSNKSVNHILFYNNTAFLSCNFGVIALNTKKKEIADTYYIGANASEVVVLCTAVNNGIIYAVTASAIYKASVADKQLVNYAVWSTLNSLPGSENIQYACSFSDKLFVMRGGKIYYQTDTGWVTLLSDGAALKMIPSGEKLFITNSSNQVYVFDKDLNRQILSAPVSISDVVYDQRTNTKWFAAGLSGVISENNSEFTYYKPSGPALNIPWDMTFSGKKLFVVPGGRVATQNMTPAFVMMYEDGKWTNITQLDIENQTHISATDFMNVAVVDSADHSHFFATSFGTGLYEFLDNKIYKLWNTTNSPITSVIPSNPNMYTRLDGAVYDKDKNLYFINESGQKSVRIQIFSSDRKWYTFTYPFGSISQSQLPTMGKISFSKVHPTQKWITSLRYNPGICIIDDNGTPTDMSDDKKTKFIENFVYKETDSGGKVTYQSVAPALVYTLAEDKNGTVWVGTDQGPFLFPNSDDIFNSDFSCSRVKIPRNDGTDLADYLLVNERIKSIAIDGANRKWLGTESSGVYLMSEDGQTTIHHFTDANSPLLSNDILSIAINPTSGEVFFGTSLGIVSYQSDASEASYEFSNVHAYPNPVRENYTGVITITGLVPNTRVKITDISGNLVCQTVSNGGLATWNGKDLHGRKVNTGVYLAMCASEDGSKSAIAKILVIN